ncbi:MAG: flavin reductase family protein [Candidatus Omnitrophota bacterium]
MRKEINLDLATRLINHGPVVLVSSAYEGRRDITPVAWHMPVSKKPPTIVLEIGEKHFIYECIVKTGDFVVNIPDSSLAEKIVKCGSVSGRDVDKFEMYDLETEPSHLIKSPSLRGAIAVLECVLIKDEHLMNEYNMIPAQVKYAEAEEEAFGEHWLFERDDMKTIHHLGNRTFCVPDKKIMDLR